MIDILSSVADMAAFSARSAFWSVACFISIGCSQMQPMQATPPGVTAPRGESVRREPFETGMRAPQQAGLTPLENVRPSSETAGAAALKEAQLRHESMSVLIYFNSGLGLATGQWTVDHRGVVQWDASYKDQRGSGEAHQKISMFMEDRRPFTSGSQLGEGQPWARYVEELILQRFLDSGSSIMDRNLLLRITADNMGTDDLFAAELGALKGEVDVIIEAHLEANPDAPEGYDVSVRATRTEDAKVLSYRSSRSMDKEKARRDYFVAVQGGFQRETDVEYLTLDEMTLSVVDRIMMDLTERFWAK